MSYINKKGEQQNSEKPFISVIVSVYNSAGTLKRCMDSLVYQTLENIEVIAVNKESTDNSEEILRRYEKAFPGKVKVYNRPYSPNAAAGRNFGIKVAQADYLAFADTDDYYELNAFMDLYQHVKEHPSDIVFYKANIITNTGTRVSNYCEPLTIANAVQHGGICAFWNKLFRAELMRNFMEIPSNVADDVAYVPAIISHSKKISCLPEALYNYFLIEQGLSANKQHYRFYALTDAFESIIENCNPKYRKNVFVFIAIRARNLMNSATRFIDHYVSFLQKYASDFINNSELKLKPDFYNPICNYIYNYTDWIPKTVYLNGFGNLLSEERIAYIKENAFNFGEGEVVVLNEKNCDCNNNKSLRFALENNRYEELGLYFALKNILNSGGFYIGKYIDFTLSLNNLRQYPSIFSLSSEGKISDQIFGARSDNSVIGEAFKLINERINKQEEFNLSEIFKDVIENNYDVKIGREEIVHECFRIAPFSETVVDIGDSKNYCVHNYTDCADNSDYVVVSKELVKQISSQPDDIKVLTAQKDEATTELDGIKSSDSYKMSLKLMKMGNTNLGKPLKRIFKSIKKK